MSTSIHAWSVTSVDNATADQTINWQENQPPATVNNSSRAEMARIAEFLYDLGRAPNTTQGGNSSDHYLATIDSTPEGPVGSLTVNLTFAITPHKDNDGPGLAELSLNAFAAVPLKSFRGQTSMSAGEIKANVPILVTYDTVDGGAFIIVGAPGYHANTALQSLGGQVSINNLTPAGAVFSWPAPINGTFTAPAGYLACDGSEYPKALYPELYAAIGDAYSDGNITNNTYFRVPNYQGTFLRGAYTGQALASYEQQVERDARGRTTAPGVNAVGTWPGAVAPVTDDPGSTQSDGIAAHTHSASAGTVTTSSDGSHSHTFQNNTRTWQYTAANGAQGGGSFGVNTVSFGQIPGSSTATASDGVHTHTINLALGTGDNWTTTNAVTDTRPQNIYCHWIIFAKPSDAALQQHALYNLAYRFDGTTNAQQAPAAGGVLLDTINNAYYISNTGQQGQDYGGTLAAWAAAGTGSPNGFLYAYAVGAPNFFDNKNVTSTSAPTGYHIFNYDPGSGSSGGPWSNLTAGSNIGLDFTPIAAGAAGGSGIVNSGLDYDWIAPAAGDPGTGNVTLSAWPTSIAQTVTLYISNFDRSGVDLGQPNGVFDNWGESTNPVHKATVQIFNIADGKRDQFIQFYLTGDGTAQTGYYEFTATVEAFGTQIEASPDNIVSIDYARTGDAQAGAITTGWHTLYVPASFMTQGVTNGATHSYNEYGANNVLVQSLAYENALTVGTEQVAAFFLGMPNSWNPAFGLRFEPIWLARGGNTGTVIWQFNANGYADGANLDVPLANTPVTSTDTNITGPADLDGQEGPLTSVLSVGSGPFDFIYCQVKRLSISDTYDSTAQLVGVKVYLYYDQPVDLT